MKRKTRGVRTTGKKRRRKYTYKKPVSYRRVVRTGEKKFHQIAVDDAVVASGMIVQLALLTIPEGVGEEQRIGRSITVTNIGWHFTVKLLATTDEAATADHCRVMLVQDKQANGALAANTDVLDTSDVFSFNNLANSKRFRTLMDRNYSLSAQSGGTSGAGIDQFGEQIIYDSFYKECNIPIEYNNDATTGVIGTITSNNIIVLVGTQGGFCKFDSIIRFRYTDL